MSTYETDSITNNLLRKMFKIRGVDKRGRPLLQIMAASFLHRSVSVDGLSKYLEARIYPELENREFSVLYVNTGVERCANFPGFSALRAICDEAIPTRIKANIADVYFLHPGINSKLFLAAFGRLNLRSWVVREDQVCEQAGQAVGAREEEWYPAAGLCG